MAHKPTPKKMAAKKPAVVVKKAAVPAKSGTPSKPAPSAVKAPAKPALKKAAAKSPPPAAAKTVPVVAKPLPVAAPVSPKPEPVAPVAVVTPSPVLPSARLLPGPKGSTTSGALTISIQTSQGAAANGNTHPANILVIVTSGGTPVVDLNRDHFTLMEHFEVPGQGGSFSNNITSFRNAGTGAYLLQTKPFNNTPWRSGHHLGQLLVSSDDDRQGQAGLKIIIR